MKKVCIFAAFVGMVLLSACDKTISPAIAGTWRVSKFVNTDNLEYPDSPQHPNMYYKFSDDNTYIVQESDASGTITNIASSAGKWELTDEYTLKLNDSDGHYCMAFTIQELNQHMLVILKTDETAICQSLTKKIYFEK